ncbi:MAG: CAP domain-containing protein [Chitinophagales bacterium]|nr:CAP domain-containing protein [Chitinophagales bacterium]
MEKYLAKIPSFATDNFFKNKAYEKNLNLDSIPEANQKISIANLDLHLMNWCLYAATMEIRARYKCKPLNYNECLRNAAFVHAHQMIIYEFFSHLNPYFPELKTPSQRMGFCTKNISYDGENINLNFFEDNTISYKQMAREIVNSLFQSKGHRRNMLSDKYNSLGCGAFWSYNQKENRHKILGVQCFAYLY